MLSEKDKNFITRWEVERERLNSLSARLIGGLPMAILFCTPVLAFVAAVYLFFPEWYTRVSSSLPGSIVTIIFAVVICILFFSYFRMQYKWETNEQHYRELKSKAGKKSLK
jgi:uncharacterized BrkB/YihY/UPF0761 family membrane protein